MEEKLFALFIFFPLLLFCLSVHESAHAWTAHKFGDDTAKQLGRITLNPVPHMDIIGTLFLPIMAIMTGAALIGWGKPVPVDTRNFSKPRWASLWVAAAGPISNLMVAVLFALGIYLLVSFFPQPAPIDPETLGMRALSKDVVGVFALICYMGVQLNLLLAFFNLIPLFPLDGGNVLRGLLPEAMIPAYDRFSRFSILILLGLFVTGLLRYVWIPVAWMSDLLLP